MPIKSLILLSGICVAMIAGPAAAQVPTYDTFQIQARSNFSGAYNLPNSTFFSGITVQLNDYCDVAFNLGVLAGSDAKAFWLGGNGQGQIVHTTPEGSFISNITMNNLAYIVHEQTFSSLDGLYFYDGDTGSNGFLTRLPFGATGWSSPTVNDSGEVGYRANFAGDRAWISFDGVSATAIHAVEAGLDPGSPYSFLFTPSFNNARQIAGKVRLGGPGQTGNSQPDQIRVFNSDGTSVPIAEDRDGNPASPYSSFDNSVSLTDTGWVSFTANIFAGGRGVFLSDGTTTITIATTADPNISDIEFFASDANDAGLVAFRAFDGAGLRAIWVGDGQTLRRVVTEHDILPSDLGSARVDQHDSSPVFGGGVNINACGDLAFTPGLTPPDNNQIEWGSGVYVAMASRTADGDFDCDGDLDLVDYGFFAECFAGPDALPNPTTVSSLKCLGTFDKDEDGDVDLLDFASFQDGFTG